MFITRYFNKRYIYIYIYIRYNNSITYIDYIYYLIFSAFLTIKFASNLWSNSSQQIITNTYVGRMFSWLSMQYNSHRWYFKTLVRKSKYFRVKPQSSRSCIVIIWYTTLHKHYINTLIHACNLATNIYFTYRANYSCSLHSNLHVKFKCEVVLNSWILWRISSVGDVYTMVSLVCSNVLKILLGFQL